MTYPWYVRLESNNEIQQGDLIPDCPIVVPPSKLKEGDEPEIEIININSIVLSQSCDLVNRKADIVLVCPYYPLSLWLENLPVEQKSKKAQRKAIDNLKKGFLASYHLLNEFDKELELADFQVVDFRNVYGVKFDLLEEIVQDLNIRARLLPPYREQLSQSFARYFMRVGLPQDLVLDGYIT